MAEVRGSQRWLGERGVHRYRYCHRDPPFCVSIVLGKPPPLTGSGDFPFDSEGIIWLGWGCYHDPKREPLRPVTKFSPAGKPGFRVSRSCFLGECSPEFDEVF